MKTQIKPGFFGKTVAADTCRRGFDLLNSQVLYCGRRPDVLFVGDSVTQWWDLSLYFGDLGYLVNRGIGGDTTEIILKRSDADVFQLSPKRIVYMAGINDLLTVCPDYWYREAGADREAVKASILANVESFVKKCEGIELYLCSITPMDLCLPFCLTQPEELAVEVNAQLRALAQRYGAVYVDYHSALKNETDNKLRAGLSTDGVHPEGEAYAIMADVLRSSLRM